MITLKQLKVGNVIAIRGEPYRLIIDQIDDTGNEDERVIVSGRVEDDPEDYRWCYLDQVLRIIRKS